MPYDLSVNSYHHHTSLAQHGNGGCVDSTALLGVINVILLCASHVPTTTTIVFPHRPSQCLLDVHQLVAYSICGSLSS